MSERQPDVRSESEANVIIYPEADISCQDRSQIILQIFLRRLASTCFLNGYSGAFAVLKNDDVAFVT